MSAIEDIAAERRRQIEVEGWSSEHDDDHPNGALGRAAACYAAGEPLFTIYQTACYADTPHTDPISDDGPMSCPVIEQLWPWVDDWWKPTSRRRDLIKAGALIVAEIERLDRAAASSDNRPSLKDASPEDVRIALNVPPYPDASEKQD